MYLEPDERYKYGYLEAVKSAIEKPQAPDESIENDKAGEALESCKKKIERYRQYWYLYDIWLTLRDKNITLNSWFRRNNISTVALYGIGMFAEHLISELKNSQIRIVYGVDRRNQRQHSDFSIYSPRDDWPKKIIDAFVITSAYDCEEIKEILKKRVTVPVFVLGEILEELIKDYRC